MQQRGTMLAFAAVIAATACGDSTPPGTVTSVSITGAPTGSIAVSRTVTLTATAAVTNGAANAVNWTSSNTAVATLAQSGNSATVTAVAPGTSNIVATSSFDATKTASVTITVVPRVLNFAATMTPGGEPGTLNGNPTGSGTFAATLDTITNVFTWTGSVTGLTSNINNGHIHGPFVTGGSATTAGVLLNFNPAQAQTGTSNLVFTGFGSANAGNFSGTVPLTAAFAPTPTINGDSLRKLILNNAVYVNIHTASNAGGEVRAQLARVP